MTEQQQAARTTTTSSTTVPATTISSLRVEKPGKSKFEPVLGGERRRPTAAASTATVSGTTAPAAKLAAADAPLATPTTELPLGLDVSSQAVAAPGTKRQATTVIETVASRRERRKSIPAHHEATSTAQASPQSAATLALNFTPSERGRITMAHFLRDTGTGIPMSGGGGQMVKKAEERKGASTPKRTAATRLMATTLMPQVRVVDGEIVVDEQIEFSAGDNPLVEMEVVNETGKHLTSHAFVKTIGNNRWGREETDRFYEALSMCGTDFALISLLFPHRTREQVKGKYKVEERTNPTKVALYLKKKKPLDTEWLERVQKERQDREGNLGAGISGPTPAGEERKPGRPKREGIDGLLSGKSSLASSPIKQPQTPSPTKVVPSMQDIFTTVPSLSPRKSPRIAASRYKK